jgi:hypothetical protein
MRKCLCLSDDPSRDLFLQKWVSILEKAQSVRDFWGLFLTLPSFFASLLNFWWVITQNLLRSVHFLTGTPLRYFLIPPLQVSSPFVAPPTSPRFVSFFTLRTNVLRSLTASSFSGFLILAQASLSPWVILSPILRFGSDAEETDLLWEIHWIDTVLGCLPIISLWFPLKFWLRFPTLSYFMLKVSRVPDISSCFQHREPHFSSSLIERVRSTSASPLQSFKLPCVRVQAYDLIALS